MIDPDKMERLADGVARISARVDAIVSRSDAANSKMYELVSQLNQMRQKLGHSPFSKYEFESEGEVKAEISAAKRAIQGGKDPWMYGNRA